MKITSAIVQLSRIAPKKCQCCCYNFHISDDYLRIFFEALVQTYIPSVIWCMNRTRLNLAWCLLSLQGVYRYTQKTHFPLTVQFNAYMRPHTCICDGYCHPQDVSVSSPLSFLQRAKLLSDCYKYTRRRDKTCFVISLSRTENWVFVVSKMNNSLHRISVSLASAIMHSKCEKLTSACFYIMIMIMMMTVMIVIIIIT